MAWIPGGRFCMGSDVFYPEERPARHVDVGGFWIDPGPVSNADFVRFVEATRYITLAERADTGPAGALVFRPTEGSVPLNNPSAWWHFVAGACWHAPEGLGSTVAGRQNHPVVQIALADARAYAVWAGKRLPAEAEWEYAARGGRDGAAYAWGAEPNPGGRFMANTWQGGFPWADTAEDGFAGTSPIGSFPLNGYGLADMIGNVWEWTVDVFAPADDGTRPVCCGGAEPGKNQVYYAVKGGSFLCAPDYCQRYRPAARQPQTADTATCHLGFRCVRDA